MTEYIAKYNIPKETLIITALLHDLCKVNYYITDTRNDIKYTIKVYI